MIRLKALFILLMASTLWLVACQTEEECEPRPCRPPMLISNIFNFDLKDVDDQVIELTLDNVDQISFKIDEFYSESLTAFDNQLRVNLDWIDEDYSVRPFTTYTLCTPFGADQLLTFIATEESGESKCSCEDYYISHIIQNEADTLFDGFFRGELLSVSIN